MSVRGVEKSVAAGPDRLYLLRRIALDVRPGEFMSIMGPSGAGKSTLLHILGMHDAAWSGEYWFLGEPIHTLAPKPRAALQKRHIGFVFQSYHLLDDLTVYENIELPLSYRDVRKADRQGMVADILDRFGIVAKKDLRGSDSGGRGLAGRSRPCALGLKFASRHSRGGEVLRRGLGLALLGAGAGLLLAFGLTRFMASLLYGVTPGDRR
jgi:ABC-type Fe3+/spermidine/putrescine transport system ATPase subunit